VGLERKIISGRFNALKEKALADKQKC
jgi:hypothetical protein